MNHLHRSVVALCIAAFAIVSCSQEDTASSIQGTDTAVAEGVNNSTISLLPPSQLLSSRAIDPDALSLTITVINDGEAEVIFGTPDPATGLFVGNAFIPTGTTVEVGIMWTENVDDEEFPLATVGQLQH